MNDYDRTYFVGQLLIDLVEVASSLHTLEVISHDELLWVKELVGRARRSLEAPVPPNHNAGNLSSGRANK